jgi:hypothetical protein
MMEIHNQSWTQLSYYEHVVFHCRLFFEHGHVALYYQNQSIIWVQKENL